MTHPVDSISSWQRVEPDALAELTAPDSAVHLLVALHGDTAALHDALAGRSGAFDRLVSGLAGVRGRHAIACETIVVADNLAALPRIVDLASALGVARCVFAAPCEAASAIMPIDVVVAAVRQALSRCRELGVQGLARHLPACLLADDAAALTHEVDDADPPRFACLYAAGCELGGRCAGLSTGYIHRFGWEERRLRPLPRVRPRAAASEPPRAYAGWRALLGPAAARVVAVALGRRTARFTLDVGGGRSLILELTPRDDLAPAFARSRTFNIRYTRVADIEPREIARIVEPIAASIVARDDGTHDLDPRRGLPPLPPR